VAGLKGAGKSTFIRSIAQGTLPPRIAALLPKEAETWPELPAGHANAWLPCLIGTAAPIPGAILHYDLHHFYRPGSRHPSRQALLLARRVTVINVFPAVERLNAQFNKRESQALLLRVLESGANGASSSRSLKSMERIRTRRSDTLRLYSTPGWVEEVRRNWNAFVREAVAGAESCIVDIEPQGPVGDAVGWRLKQIALGSRLVEVEGGEPI
jgi:hypothetical protein